MSNRINLSRYVLLPAELLLLVQNMLERDGVFKPVRAEVLQEIKEKSIHPSEVPLPDGTCLSSLTYEKQTTAPTGE